jgi:hypothetical protein
LDWRVTRKGWSVKALDRRSNEEHAIPRINSLFAKESRGFIHERMLERAGVDVQGGGFEAELSPGFAPGGDRREDLAESFL